MSVTPLPRRRARRSVALLAGAAALLAVVVLPVRAHAELVTSVPAAGSTVPGPYAGPIVLTFDEALKSGSKFDLLDAGGRVIGTAGPDARDAPTMTLRPETPLAAGTYTIRWTSVAADGDVARDTFTFSVAAPTPRPTPAPTATALATPTPSANPVVSPSPSPAPADGSATSTSDAILPVIAALALIGVMGLVLLRRRGARPR